MENKLREEIGQIILTVCTTWTLALSINDKEAGKEAVASGIDQLLLLIKKHEEETYLEILSFLDKLEMEQPQHLKKDNWRNWKYIRNSIIDKYLAKLKSSNKKKGSDG